MNTPYTLTDPKDLDKLPVGSVVICKESEYGDHVAWSLVDDVLTDEDEFDGDVPDKIWASPYYKNENDSATVLHLSYDDQVTVVYVHPGK